jgi:hypothetical protein
MSLVSAFPRLPAAVIGPMGAMIYAEHTHRPKA